jgi:membrane protease YdiL (CAAX protease family)
MGEADAESNADRKPATRWFDRHPEQPLARVSDSATRGDTLFQVVAVLVLALLGQVLLVSIGVGLLSGLNVTENGSPVVYYGTQSALGLFAFCLVGVAYLLVREDETLVGIRWPTTWDLGMIVGGFLLLAGTLIGAETLLSALGFESADNVVLERGQENPELFLVLIPIQFLLTGPGEELLFRGVIQGLLRRAYGVVPGILAASTLFALFHVPSLSGNSLLPVLSVLFLSGVVLGALYEYTRTLLVPMVAHALWNALVFGTEYAGAVGSVFG